MVSKRRILMMMGELEARVAEQSSEISALRKEIEGMRKEERTDTAPARERASDAQRRSIGFGDFRASHPFRPDQGRKES